MQPYSLILLLILFSLSCNDTPTKIERDNPNDLESSTFSLEELKGITSEILENKVIKISWEDSLDFADYFILSKSLNSSEEFSILDTLNINSREYFDETGIITQNTRYLIYKEFSQKNGNTILSDSIITGIDFGGLNSYSTSYNSDTTAVEFKWDFDSKWPFVGILYNYDNNLEREVALDTVIGANSLTTPSFEKDFGERFYTLKFFFSNEQIDTANPLEQLTGGYYGGMEFIPEITNIEIIDEAKVIINWEDNSSFEDGFEVLRSQNSSDEILYYEVIASLKANETTFTDTLRPFDSYEVSGNKEVKYGIQATKGNTSASQFDTKVQIPKIEFVFSVSELNSNSFNLIWSTESSNVSEYVLQTSLDGINFNDFKTFPNTTTSYTGLSSDFPASLYYFRIRSITSSPSLSVGLSYSPELIEEDFFAFAGSRNFRFSDSGNLLIAAKGSFFDLFELGVSIYDLNSKSVIYSKDLLNSSIHGIDIDETNDRIAVGSTTNRSVAVYDYKVDTLLYLKDNFSVYDVQFSNDGNALYTNSSRGLLSKHNLLTKEIDFTKSDGVSASRSNIRRLSLSPTGDSIAYNISGFLNISDTLGNTIGFNNISNLEDISQDVRFSKTGSYIILANRLLGAFIYNAKNNERYLEFPSRYVSIDHREKLVIGGSSYQLNLLDLEQRSLIAAYTLDEQITNLAFSPTTDNFAVGTSSGIRFYSLSSLKEWKEIESDFSLRFPLNPN